MKVTIYSHNYAVTEYGKAGYQFLMRFTHANFVELDDRAMRINRWKNGSTKPVIKNIYAAMTENRKEFRFHVNTLHWFKKAVKAQGLEDHVTYVVEPMYTPKPFEIKIHDGFKPRDYQVPYVEYIYAPGAIKLLNLGTGMGKALRKDQRILTPKGFVAIEDLQIGDEVIGRDGNIYHVLDKHDQGVVDLYTVTFEDGRQSVCCGRHQWMVLCDDEWSLQTTDTLIGIYNRQDIYIDTPQPWIGDPDAVNPLDGPIIERQQTLLGYMRQYGCEGNVMRFNASELHHGTAVVYLIRSLGYYAYIRHEGEYAVIYTNWSEVEYICTTNDFPVDVRLKLTGITPAQPDEAFCITVDSPDCQFITQDFITTHNTATSLFAAAKLNGRILITVAAGFFNLWVEAFDGGKSVVDCNFSKEVMFVKGSKDLRALMELALSGNLEDEIAIVISARTLTNYHELYEKFNGEIEDYYPIQPIDFYKTLGIALRIKDEVHLSLYANYMEEMYLHCPKSVSLSATLEDGSYRDRVLGIMFPQHLRAEEAKIDKYIDITALMYSLHDVDNAVYSRRGSTDYSHNAFEAYILKFKKRFHAYYQIMKTWLEKAYLKRRVDQQKACIFVDSIEMATAVYKRFVADFPQLKVARYAASTGDVYEEAKQADLLITTVKSFGTGFDLEDLLCCLMTNAIKSRNTNVQVLGRTRKMKKYPDTNPTFHYLVCLDIVKHVEYHKEKIKQFEDKARSQNEEYLTIKV